MTNQPIRISAKHLGYLALPDYCPRCFWINLKSQFKLPWQIFPGIFSSIDSYTKKITWSYYEKYKVLPQWFSTLGEFEKPVKIPPRSQFSLLDPNTNILLTGVPDDIFQKTDGSYYIVDYKTAKYTANQDSLLPIYIVQLNGYVLIAERCGLKPVSGIGLCYYEPQTNVNSSSLDSVLLDQGFYMPFTAHLLELDLDPVIIVSPLLAMVRELGDREDTPDSRKGCEDCRRLEGIVGALSKFGQS